MNLAVVHSRARTGVRAPDVRVEVHLGGGLPSMSIVGLPEAAVRESKDRVRAAIQCAQFEFPQRRITVNLAPADLPKDGGRFDLPIALGILAASGQVPLEALRAVEFLGELGLTGELRAVEGVLPAAIAAADAGHRLVVPAGNGPEAALAGRVEARTARTLLEVCAMLGGQKSLPEAVAPAPTRDAGPDLADVRGQAHARRALEIAAAGGHHLLLVGPPGCGAGWTRHAGASGPTGARTTPRARWRWSAGARCRGRARSPWPTRACCSWMSCPSGTDTRLRSCASRWSRAWSPCRARRAPPSSRRGSN